MTPEQISIFLPGTFPVTATATLRYRKIGGQSWIAGPPLFRIRPDFAAGRMTIDGGFAWAVFGLTPGTSYELEVTIHNGSDKTFHTAMMSTRALPRQGGSPTKVITAGSTSVQIQKVFKDAEIKN